MTSIAPEVESTYPLTSQAREMACEAGLALTRLSGSGTLRVDVTADHGARQSFVLPAAAVDILRTVLMLLGEGRGVSVVPAGTELTTQQAADMLNVSRPYLIRLLERGKLPFHMVGTHRRVTLNALLAYSFKRDVQAFAARDRLTEEAQELDMGY